MKWLLYIFLLANLAGFFWHYQPGLFRSGADRQVQVSVDEDSVPQLVLLKEFESKRQNLSVQEKGIESCFNLGPFAKRKEAVAINKELTSLGVVATLQVNKEKTRPGYWVLIPPEADRKAARKHISQLKEKGIKDYFLVATGSQKNAISLGVFSRSELAQRRHAAIKKLGFKVSIDKVALPKREYWLEWPTSTEAVVSTEILDRWRKAYPAIGNTKMPCHEKS